MYSPTEDVLTAYAEYKKRLHSTPEYQHLVPLPIEKFATFWRYYRTLDDARLYTQDIDLDRPPKNNFNARIRTK